MTLRPPAAFDPGRHGTDHFCSGRPQLDTWLRAYAGQGERRDASRTYVVTDEHDAVVACYTLVATQIEHELATPQVRRGMSKRFPIPAVLLARLAVDRRHQGRGLGAALLADALRRSIRAATDVGIRAVLIDAMDDDAAAFYRRFGFTALTDDGLILMATVAQLHSAAEPD